MADDVPINAGLAGAMGGGLSFAASAVGDVMTELTSFTKFRDRIDELLRELKESPADPKQVGQDAMTRTNFGGGGDGWVGASGLFGSYQTVITELEQLSKLMSDSIEGMSIAVMASHKGYENVEAEVRERMLAIGRNATKHYGGAYEPGVSDAGAGTGQPGGDTAGASGLA
ncbi:hypothetical protein [Streptomyces sp. NBC_01304]|uniref:hypothetical protein n=1 Tax=Streptomyces sp. NBC_01304 TaxID=2903818 RepID=UPI002E0E4ADE|nr:hypothetical protein OG430_10965 [Streptomyces sp. NBC_01304]